MPICSFRILPLVALPCLLVLTQCRHKDPPPPVPIADAVHAPAKPRPPMPANQSPSCIGLGCEQSGCIGLGCEEQASKCIGMGCEEGMGPKPKGN